MSYSHSFSAAFYGDPYECAPSDRPTTVCDALATMAEQQPKLWAELALQEFQCAPEFLDIDAVLVRLLETDTVDGFETPVGVYIDDDGYFSVGVYDELAS